MLRHHAAKRPESIFLGERVDESWRHLSYDDDPPVTNLFLNLLGKLGVPRESFGDSTGALEELSDV